MIRCSVLYPASENAKFDHDYYRDKHVPLVEKTWGVKGEIDKGLNGPFVAAVHFCFDSADAMTAAMSGPGSAEVHADVANYTDIAPVIQVSQIVR